MIEYLCDEYPELGGVIFAKSAKGICFLTFGRNFDALYAKLEHKFPDTVLQENKHLKAELSALLKTGQTESQLDLVGTPFQQAVWQALFTIPKGSVCSYQDIAIRINRPQAVRAVGTALGANPVAWLIPCHRVISKNGGIGGFGCGLTVKKVLLAREGVFL